MLPAHGSEEGHGESGGRDPSEYVQEVQGSIRIPHAREEAPPQLDNATIMALLAGM